MKGTFLMGFLWSPAVLVGLKQVLVEFEQVFVGFQRGLAVWGHLVEQGGDGIVAPVEDEEQRRDLSFPEVEQFVLFSDDLLKNIKQQNIKATHFRLSASLRDRSEDSVRVLTFRLSASLRDRSEDSW